MTARTYSFLRSALVLVATAAVVVWLGHLAVEAEIRNAYGTAVSTP